MFLELRVRVCVHQDKQGKVQKVKAPNLLRGPGQQARQGSVVKAKEERKSSIRRPSLAVFNSKLSLKR